MDYYSLLSSFNLYQYLTSANYSQNFYSNLLVYNHYSSHFYYSNSRISQKGDALIFNPLITDFLAYCNLYLNINLISFFYGPLVGVCTLVFCSIVLGSVYLVFIPAMIRSCPVIFDFISLNWYYIMRIELQDKIMRNTYYWRCK